MRAVDRSGTAAIILCFFGYLFSKAATKTLPEDTAAQGKKSLWGFCPLFFCQRKRLAGYFGGQAGAASQLGCWCDLNLASVSELANHSENFSVSAALQILNNNHITVFKGFKPHSWQFYTRLLGVEIPEKHFVNDSRRALMLSSCCDLSVLTLQRLANSPFTRCFCLHISVNLNRVTCIFKKTAAGLCSLKVRVVIQVTETATYQPYSRVKLQAHHSLQSIF